MLGVPISGIGLIILAIIIGIIIWFLTQKKSKHKGKKTDENEEIWAR